MNYYACYRNRLKKKKNIPKVFQILSEYYQHKVFKNYFLKYSEYFEILLISILLKSAALLLVHFPVFSFDQFEV